MLLLFGVLVAVSDVPALAADDNPTMVLSVTIPHTDVFLVGPKTGDGTGVASYNPGANLVTNMPNKEYTYHEFFSMKDTVSNTQILGFTSDVLDGVQQDIGYKAMNAEYANQVNKFIVELSANTAVPNTHDMNISFTTLGPLYQLCTDDMSRRWNILPTNGYSLYVDDVLIDSGSYSAGSGVRDVSWSGVAKDSVRIEYNVANYASTLITPLHYKEPEGGYKIRIGVETIGLMINNVLTDVELIEVGVGDIRSGVIDIRDNFVDMKDQLSNPESSIWSAGSSAIGNAVGEKVGELFTPSADDLTTATDALKDTMTDKLGGAYDAVDAVTGAGEQMRDKLKNPTPTESITFPGISVPAAGMVEGFTILPSMEVSLPPKLTAVLQPVAGSIVCVLVGMYTLSSLKDMVICFMSSMSYAEYLHRNKGGGSE